MRDAMNAAIAAFFILWLGGFTEAANANADNNTPLKGCVFNGLHLQAWVHRYPDFLKSLRLSEGQRRLVEVGCLTIPQKAR